MPMFLKTFFPNSLLYKSHFLQKAPKYKVQICPSSISVFECKHKHTSKHNTWPKLCIKTVFLQHVWAISLTAYCKISDSIYEDTFWMFILFIHIVNNVDNFKFFRGEKDDFIVWTHTKWCNLWRHKTNQLSPRMTLSTAWTFDTT